MDDLDPRFLLTYDGVVVRNDDPENRKRVQVKVLGLLEPHSDWAEPAGLGGGKKQRGIFFAPEVGSDVLVGFKMADEHRPYYHGGHWGAGEESTATVGLSAADAAKMHAIETEKFLISFDDKTGTLVIKEKTGSAFIRITNGKVEVGGVATEHAVLGDVWKTKEGAILDQIQLITVSTAVGPSSVPINAASFAAIKALLGDALATVTFVK
jgi:hypothetical protein